MPLIAKDNKLPKENPHLGLHDAVLVFVKDIGTHIKKTTWGNKAQHEVIFCWEIEQLMAEGENAGKPFMISRRYNFTLYKSNLSKMLESWFAKEISDEKREQGIDLELLIGKRSTLNLKESANGKYINIDAVLPPRPDNKVIIYRKEIPNWLLMLIETSTEKTGANGGDDQQISADCPPPDDLPF
jgi:hypothetical protein